MYLRTKPQIHTQEELRRFLDDFEGDLFNLMKEISKLLYKQIMKKSVLPKMDELQEQFMNQAFNPHFEELLYQWDDRVEEPILRRRLFLLKRNFLAKRFYSNSDLIVLSKEIDEEQIKYQYLIGDKNVNIRTIKHLLKTSPDPLMRKQAWLAKNALSELIAPKMLKVIKLRNDLARESGYNTYADYMLKMDDISLKDVKDILLNLTSKTNVIYSKILADGQNKFGLNEIKPWDLTYLLDQMGINYSNHFLKSDIETSMQSWAIAHGANWDELGIRVVCADIPNNGSCLGLDDRDIRIVAKPIDGYNFYNIMFHELGHAFHIAYNRQKPMVFNQEARPMREGLAELISYVTRDPEWLKEKGFHSDELSSTQKRLIAPWFHFLRESTAYALAEYQIYENPKKNPDSILAQIEHEILGITLDYTPRWTTNTWYTRRPIFWQNFVLGDLIASQIQEKLKRKYGGLHGYPEAFKEISHTYYAPGASIDWQERILKHTGSKLKPDALIKDLQAYL